MDMLANGEASFDSLAERSGMSIAELNTSLSALVIYGLVHEVSKNVYGLS